uniref:ATP synthase Fo subunit 8 n=1 Tax=Caridina sp. WA4 TaxID=382100 RepID=A0A3S8ILK4_9EUCA|nr:ATP synthase Fo subunit 8 [Caridina sp. WA4]AZH80609.1 ATP synthase Fo subunit 8 [Caridina sp. WA4]
MAPLFWLSLFIFFSVTYIMFLISNYFLHHPESLKLTTTKQLPSKLYWKW